MKNKNFFFLFVFIINLQFILRIIANFAFFVNNCFPEASIKRSDCLGTAPLNSQVRSCFAMMRNDNLTLAILKMLFVIARNELANDEAISERSEGSFKSEIAAVNTLVLRFALDKLHDKNTIFLKARLPQVLRTFAMTIRTFIKGASSQIATPSSRVRNDNSDVHKGCFAPRLPHLDESRVRNDNSDIHKGSKLPDCHRSSGPSQ